MCDGAEITVECNPSSVTGEFVHRIKNAGVNRVSMGMQSAVATERLALGRQSGTEKSVLRIECPLTGKNSRVYQSF